MKIYGNECNNYMDEHNWIRVSDGGTCGIYSNGTLFVMCNGSEWFASKTPDAGERWSKGWASMLPAMRFADSKTRGNQKAKIINYYVIGGQYEQYCYGGSETLHGAKLIAAKHDEYWDNWQGWNRPAIYKAEDCIMANTFYGEQMVHKPEAFPVATYDMTRKRWETPEL